MNLWLPEPQVVGSIPIEGAYWSPANRHDGIGFSWFHKCAVVEIDEIAFAMSPIIVVTWIEPYRSLASTH